MNPYATIDCILKPSGDGSYSPDVSREPAEPAGEVEAPILAAGSLAEVVDLLLKDHRQLDAHLRTDAGQRRLIPQLLGIALCGFALYGVVATFMLNLAHTSHHFWLAGLPAAEWTDATIGNLTLSYCIGMIAANGICLPSFYFYGLLSGIRISMLGVTAHALKGMAAGAVALVGILPIYVAATLNALIYSESYTWLSTLVALGLLLPFIAGLWGALSLYRGFVGLADTIPPEFRRSRTCLLRRLILAWSGCYTFVTPLVIYSLWQHLS
ncbi:MAG: hypothetical protein K8U03_20485 [Planctomycetia bacterium]|nr:hypothetical protein [Planctomycetia bacterium]